MKLCNDCAGPLCDFCKYYIFDKSLCDLHGEKRVPHEECDDFHCKLRREEV